MPAWSMSAQSELRLSRLAAIFLSGVKRRLAAARATAAGEREASAADDHDALAASAAAAALDARARRGVHEAGEQHAAFDALVARRDLQLLADLLDAAVRDQHGHAAQDRVLAGLTRVDLAVDVGVVLGLTEDLLGRALLVEGRILLLRIRAALGLEMLRQGVAAHQRRCEQRQ
jgi:hypothetical protein